MSDILTTQNDLNSQVPAELSEINSVPIPSCQVDAIRVTALGLDKYSLLYSEEFPDEPEVQYVTARTVRKHAVVVDELMRPSLGKKTTKIYTDKYIAPTAVFDTATNSNAVMDVTKRTDAILCVEMPEKGAIKVSIVLPSFDATSDLGIIIRGAVDRKKMTTSARNNLVNAAKFIEKNIVKYILCIYMGVADQVAADPLADKIAQDVDTDFSNTITRNGKFLFEPKEFKSQWGEIMSDIIHCKDERYNARLNMPRNMSENIINKNERRLPEGAEGLEEEERKLRYMTFMDVLSAEERQLWYKLMSAYDTTVMLGHKVGFKVVGDKLFAEERYLMKHCGYDPDNRNMRMKFKKKVFDIGSRSFSCTTIEHVGEKGKRRVVVDPMERSGTYLVEVVDRTKRNEPVLYRFTGLEDFLNKNRNAGNVWDGQYDQYKIAPTNYILNSLKESAHRALLQGVCEQIITELSRQPTGKLTAPFDELKIPARKNKTDKSLFDILSDALYRAGIVTTKDAVLKVYIFEKIDSVLQDKDLELK